MIYFKLAPASAYRNEYVPIFHF